MSLSISINDGDRGRMRGGRHLLVFLAIASLLPIACAEARKAFDAAVVPPHSRRQACIPRFPYAGGWLGGDAAFSIPLPDHGDDDREARRTVWLFGDSFVADAPQRDREDAEFIHNSIGISRCNRRGEFEIAYHWRRDPEGRHEPFFDTGTPSPYWWLFDGFVHDGALYVGLLELEEARPDDVMLLPIRMTGMKLARIDDPAAAPEDWKIDVATLSHSVEAFPGSSMVVQGDHVYLFSFTELRDGHQPRFLSRLPLAALEPLPEDLSPSLETWTKSHSWQPGFRPDLALMLMDDNASEMSVEFDDTLGRWLAVYGSPIQTRDAGRDPADAPPEMRSDRIYLRHAERLEGPWSERLELHRIAELDPTDRDGDPNRFCYAAKAHHEFSPPGRLLVTYVCNLMTLPGEDPWPILVRLTKDMDIYRPVPVILPIPPSIEREDRDAQR